ncbi:MAG: sugar phosphate isomerase/epimerase [Candidatus Bathyarchaeia archaeon]
MRIGTTPNPRLEIIEEIKSISRLKFDFVELSIGNWILSKKKVLIETKNLELGLTGHLPDIDLCNPNPKKNRELLQRFIESIDIFHELGIGKVVAHAFVGREVDVSKHPDNMIKDLKLQMLKELTHRCQNSNIKLCLENTEEKPEDLTMFFEELPSLYFCLDIGHANLFTEENTSKDFIEKFQHRLRHIHISDNFGGYSEKHDRHLPLGTGKIDFKTILRYLKEIGYNDTFTLEVFSRYKEYADVSKKILRRLWDEV